MRFFLFKLFVKVAGLFSAKDDWVDEQLNNEKQLKICQNRQAEMNACVRPRTYPKVKGMVRYTDYYESGRNWHNHKR